MQKNVREEIRELERKAEEIKTLSRLNRVSILEAKVRLRDLEKKLDDAVSRLQPHERELYKIKKEHGHIESGI